MFNSFYIGNMTVVEKFKRLQISRKIEIGLVAVSICDVVAAFWLLLATRMSAFLGNLVNSDLLVPADVYNAFAQGKDISTWAWAGAAYWFPDLTLYFPIRFISGDFQSAAIWYAALQVTLFTAGMMALGRQIIADYQRTFDALAIALAALYILGIPSLWMVMTSSLLSIDIHGGVLIAIPFTMALALYRLKGSRSLTSSTGALVALALIAMALTASDLLYVVEVVIPLAVAFAPTYFWMPAWRRTIAANAAAMGAGCLAGFAVDRGLRSYVDNVGIMFAPTRARWSLTALVSSTEAAVQAQPAHALLLLAFLVLAAAVAVRAAGRRQPRIDVSDAAPFVFAVFIVANLAITSAFVVATGIFFDASSLRYFLPVLVLSTGWGPALLLLPLGQDHHARWIPCVAAAVVAVISGVVLADLGQHWPRSEQIRQILDYYPASNSCLDEQLSALGVSHGVATYWQARPTVLYSRAGIQLAQVRPDLSPYYWETGLYAFDLEPQFILIDTRQGMPAEFVIDENMVVTRFGVPAAAFDCPDARALVYGRPGDTALRALFMNSLPFIRFRRPGGTYLYKPANLPGAVGTVAGSERIVHGGPPGYLSFGPYVQLPPGAYAFSIDYSAHTAQEEVGSWDVALARVGGNLVLASGPISSRGNRVQGQFVLTETAVVEIRVSYGGDGELTESAIQLTRIR